VVVPVVSSADTSVLQLVLRLRPKALAVASLLRPGVALVRVATLCCPRAPRLLVMAVC
jgi:hypothetical protein